jgi:hypothetical protein
MRGARVSDEFEKDTRQMLVYGSTYVAVGVLLVVLSYQAHGWPRWPFGIVGWLLLVAGTWTILFRFFITWLVDMTRRSGSSRARQ